MPLACGIILQVDQAASAYQGLLRNLAQRYCLYPSLDRHLRICPGGQRQEANGARPEHRYNPTDFKRHSFRENAHFTGSLGHRLQNPGERPLQPTETIQLLTEQSRINILDERYSIFASGINMHFLNLNSYYLLLIRALNKLQSSGRIFDFGGLKILPDQVRPALPLFKKISEIQHQMALISRPEATHGVALNVLVQILVRVQFRAVRR